MSGLSYCASPHQPTSKGIEAMKRMRAATLLSIRQFDAL
jgi:hypothetical protein